MQTFEAGSAVLGQTEGKKENCLIIYRVVLKESLWPIGYVFGYVHAISDCFWAGTRPIPDLASVHTWEQ